MDDDLDRLREMLSQNEHILWSGRPDPAVLFTQADLYLVPFYLLFESFAVFFTFESMSTGPAGPFDLIPIFFVAIGLYFLIGRFFVKAFGKRRTLYAVTNRRALVLNGRTLRESPLQGQARTTTKSRDGQHATVTFGEPPPRTPFGGNQRITNAGLDFFSFSGPLPVAFYDVSEPSNLLGVLAVVDRPQPA